MLDALDCVTAVGLGKENSGVRTAEAYLRGRQNARRALVSGRARRARPEPRRAKARDAEPDKEREAARWLTVRVLIVLRRVN